MSLLELKKGFTQWSDDDRPGDFSWGSQFWDISFVLAGHTVIGTCFNLGAVLLGGECILHCSLSRLEVDCVAAPLEEHLGELTHQTEMMRDIGMVEASKP